MLTQALLAGVELGLNRVLQMDSTALPRLARLEGKLITNDAESYRYLAESIRMHPDQETLKAMMSEAGFERTSYHNMTGGIVALHRGIKP